MLRSVTWAADQAVTLAKGDSLVWLALPKRPLAASSKTLISVSLSEVIISLLKFIALRCIINTEITQS